MSDQPRQARAKEAALTLAVPRRHITAALLAVNTDSGRAWNLQYVCFRPAGPGEEGKGALCTVATNGHKLVSLIGGTWEGDWPGGQTVAVHWDRFDGDCRAEKDPDTEIAIRVFLDKGERLVPRELYAQCDSCGDYTALEDLGLRERPR